MTSSYLLSRGKTEGEKDIAGSPIDLDTARERVMGDMAFLEKMLKEFDETVASYLEAIETAMEENDTELLRKTVHKLKGAALSLSLVEIAESAEELNRMALQPHLQEIPQGVAALKGSVARFRIFLSQFGSDGGNQNTNGGGTP